MIDVTRKRSGYKLIMCSYARKMERTQLSNKIFYNELQKKWKKTKWEAIRQNAGLRLSDYSKRPRSEKISFFPHATSTE